MLNNKVSTLSAGEQNCGDPEVPAWSILILNRFVIFVDDNLQVAKVALRGRLKAKG